MDLPQKAQSFLPLDFEYRPHYHPIWVFCGALLSGFLLSFSFAPFNQFYLAWFAFVPILLAVRARKDGALFWYGFLAGFTFWFSSLFWLHEIFWLAPFLLAILWAPLWGLWLWISKKIWFYLCFPRVDDTLADARHRQFVLSWQKYLVFLFSNATIWVFFEWIRSWLFGGFPWHLLGISQVNFQPIVPMAAIFGVLGISFLIIFFNLTIAYLIESFSLGKRFLWQLLTPPFIFISLILILNKFSAAENGEYETLKIAVIQGNFPLVKNRPLKPEEYLEQLQTYRNLSLQRASEKPDLIIWPETALSSVYNEDPIFQKATQDVTRICKTKLLIGSLYQQKFNSYERKTNSALLIDESGKIVARYDKTRLVPFGEYTPMKNIMKLSWWEWFNRQFGLGHLDAGNTISPLPLKSDFSLGTNICYEEIFTEISWQHLRQGAKILITLCNDSWFANTAGAAQLRAHGQFRAVENGVPLIRCGTNSESCSIDKNGTIMAKIDNNSAAASAVFMVKCNRENTHSFYFRNPQLFVAIIAILSTLIFLTTALHLHQRKAILKQLISGKKLKK